MPFQTDNYQVVRNAISQDLCTFLFDYVKLKKRAVGFLYKYSSIEQQSMLGSFGDDMIPNVYCNYADFAMETLLDRLTPLMEEETNLELSPTYSYMRVYEKGTELFKHRDRPSCEISTTLNLGGDHWPIFVEPDIQVDLAPGDMLIYKGNVLEHWRDRFEGNECIQVFLHYKTKNGQFIKDNKFDNRPFLGLPPAIYEGYKK